AVVARLTYTPGLAGAPPARAGCGPPGLDLRAQVVGEPAEGHGALAGGPRGVRGSARAARAGAGGGSPRHARDLGTVRRGPRFGRPRAPGRAAGARRPGPADARARARPPGHAEVGAPP